MNTVHLSALSFYVDCEVPIEAIPTLFLDLPLRDGPLYAPLLFPGMCFPVGILLRVGLYPDVEDLLGTTRSTTASLLRNPSRRETLP